MRAPLEVGVALASLLLLPTVLAQTTCATGRATSVLEANRVQAGLLNNGAFFCCTQPWTGYTVETSTLTNQPLSAFSSAHLWVAGRSGNAVVAAATHESGPYEFIPGPLDGQGGPPADCAAHDRIFRITADDLDQLARGTVTDAVREWPWAWGAPVIDGDGVSGNYNLAGGDHPELLGSETHWWVMNAMGAHPRTGSAPFPLEVQVTAFAAASRFPVLDEATFYRFRFVWRGPAPLTDVFVGFLSDVDLGDPSDDHTGADSALALAYTYNRDDNDGGDRSPIATGFGPAPPAIGTAFVETPDGRAQAYAIQYHVKNNGTWGTPGHFGPAGTPEAFLYRLQGLSSTGAPHPACGDGMADRYLACGTTRFTFSGEPETRTGWTMLTPVPDTAPYNAGDLRMLLSGGPYRFEPGAPEDVVVAIPWARGRTHLESVQRLREATRPLREAWAGGSFVTPFVPLPPDTTRRFGLNLGQVRPNPARSVAQLRVTMPDANQVRVVIVDAFGRTVAHIHEGTLGPGLNDLPIAVADLAPGPYTVRVWIGRRALVRSLVVVR